MTQRDLIAAAIKILGLCLIVMGVIQASTSLFSACMANHSYRSQLAHQESRSKESLSISSHMLPMYQAQQASHTFMAVFRILQVLAGIYLCKRGTAVLNFVTGKPTAVT